MSNRTPATAALDRLGVSYDLHRYEYDPEAPQIGLHAAESLGVEPGCVLKTLMALVDMKPVCVVVPSDREVSMKRLAAAAGGKSAQMMKPADAERSTGYKVGGISPFGQRKTVRTFVDAGGLGHSRVFINGGQRGLQVRLAPGDLVRALDAAVEPLC
ncbi:Cys-tRNA(Pro) deacylase [Alsobacter sp. SYSU BS001988]|jgi:Cys-tRNA(Pro)/Cys-tRNA(Cys) deacylase